MEYWVVVVDDEALSLVEAKRILDEEGMRVSCLRSGGKLLEFVEKHTPDLILLDILMPDMDGFETYSALRRYEEKEGRNSVPVIFLTGEENIEIERRGLREGASDFIHKPFDRDILISRIQNTIMNRRTIENLEEEASVDKLTGFLNKASGSASVVRLCKNSAGAFMVMDLDNFKLVNDLFGHDMGDRVLRAFSDIVRHNTREEDLISRIGGDEFMGFFSDISDEGSVESLTRRLNSQLAIRAAELMGEDHGIPLGISVGVVTVPEYGRDYDVLFAQADNALYTVKQNGKHGYAFYDNDVMNEAACENDLDHEIERITRLMQDRSGQMGAMMLGMEPFSAVYHFIMRFSKRYEVDATELLFSVSLRETEADSGDLLSKAVTKFGRVLQKILRKSDIITRNRVNQFFVFFPRLSDKDAHIVIERIFNHWNETEYAGETVIEYAVKYIDNSGEINK